VQPRRGRPAEVRAKPLGWPLRPLGEMISVAMTSHDFPALGMSSPEADLIGQGLKARCGGEPASWNDSSMNTTDSFQ
jgi:hypothetical protein